MEAIDIEKLKDILEMMVDSGAVFLKYGELIIEFPRQGTTPTTVVGFEAGTAQDGDKTEAKGNRPASVRAVGYTALFGDKMPKFPRPIAEGQV